MMTGRVNWRLEATIRVGVQDSSGNMQSVDCILDTGFDGDVSLPAAVVKRLGLAAIGSYNTIFADGITARLPVYSGILYWHEQPTPVEVLATQGDFVIGMALLENSTLTIQAWDGGDVLIEERE